MVPKHKFDDWFALNLNAIVEAIHFTGTKIRVHYKPVFILISSSSPLDLIESQNAVVLLSCQTIALYKGVNHTQIHSFSLICNDRLILSVVNEYFSSSFLFQLQNSYII